MRPIEEAAAFYKKGGTDFSSDLAAYLHYGYVISQPDFFVMGKPVKRAAGELPCQWNVKDPDTWYIKFCAGKWRRCLDIMPFPLPFVSFERFKNKVIKMKHSNLNQWKRHG